MALARNFLSSLRFESVLRRVAATNVTSTWTCVAAPVPVGVYRQLLVSRQVSPVSCVGFHSAAIVRQAENAAAAAEQETPVEGGAEGDDGAPPAAPDPKDRSRKIPVEMSMRYLKSDAYRQTYGDDPVWKMYRRNFKGQFPPKETRRTCIRNNRIATGNPCPVCRDEYLVVDHRNLDLIQQFISSDTGEILHTSKTGVCRVQQRNLTVAVLKAQNEGLISFDVPFREYDYDEYRPKN